jgi:serine/threonine protein kinase
LLRERFIREVDLSSNLSHPHIVPIFSAGEANGLFYYVMPYVEGESLRHRLLRQRRLPLEDASTSPATSPTRSASPTARGSSTATSSPKTSCSAGVTR